MTRTRRAAAFGRCYAAGQRHREKVVVLARPSGENQQPPDENGRLKRGSIFTYKPFSIWCAEGLEPPRPCDVCRSRSSRMLSFLTGLGRLIL